MGRNGNQEEEVPLLAGVEDNVEVFLRGVGADGDAGRRPGAEALWKTFVGAFVEHWWSRTCRTASSTRRSASVSRRPPSTRVIADLRGLCGVERHSRSN